jgi:hypothetical protein
MTDALKLWPIGAATLLAASPVLGQDGILSGGEIAIVAPAGINITDDASSRITLSRTGITLVASADGVTGTTGIAGFVNLESSPTTSAADGGLIRWREGAYQMTGTTLGQDVLSVSVASEPQTVTNVSDSIESLRLVVAQYN